MPHFGSGSRGAVAKQLDQPGRVSFLLETVYFEYADEMVRHPLARRLVRLCSRASAFPCIRVPVHPLSRASAFPCIRVPR